MNEITSTGLTVITGKNGTGKTRMLDEMRKRAEEKGQVGLFLDFDSHCHLNKPELEKFAFELKKKSKTQKVIIVSLRKEIIDIADKVIEL